MTKQPVITTVIYKKLLITTKEVDILRTNYHYNTYQCYIDLELNHRKGATSLRDTIKGN